MKRYLKIRLIFYKKDYLKYKFKKVGNKNQMVKYSNNLKLGKLEMLMTWKRFMT